MTFDDLPACPRCKESFALVRPLVSSSPDGARHLLRDDPDLRRELRDRLHRARLDRRKKNDNPLAGSDPDAPDWFEPQGGRGNGVAEITLAPRPGANAREEGEVVPIDDRSPDQETRASTSRSDEDTALIEASREPEDSDEPQFDGDIPGFTDWREELRERLKRIRARRQQEAEHEAEENARRAAEEADEEADEDDEAREAENVEEDAAAAAAGDEDEAAAETDEEPRDEDDRAKTAEWDAAEKDVEAKAAGAGKDEDDAEALAAPDADATEDELETAGDAAAPAARDEADDGEPETDAGEPTASSAKDIIEQLVDGPGRPGRKDSAWSTATVSDGEVDYVIERDAGDDEPDSLDFGDDDAESDDEKAGSDGDEAAVAATTPAGTERPGGFDWGDAAAIDNDTSPAEGADRKVDHADAVDEVDDVDDANQRKAHGAVGTDDRNEPGARGAARIDDDETKADEADGDGEREADGADGDAEERADAVADQVEPGEESEGEEGKSTPSPVVMPDEPGSGPTAKLDFESASKSAPEVDVPAAGDEVEGSLVWDVGADAAAPAQRSSAAPLGERAAASVCDALLLIAIGAALVGAASSGTEVPFRQILVQEALWLGLAWAILAAGYSIFLVGACGQTIGRMVMRVRVVGDDQFTVGFDRAAVRLAAWVVSALPALAGMVPALRDPQRRALHDRLSHTRVVKA